MIHIKSGGIEQALLEAANECGELSKSDKQRLAYLKTLPQNRIDGAHPQWVEQAERSTMTPYEQTITPTVN